MIALSFSFLSAACAAGANLIFRKNVEAKGNVNFYLTCYYFFSLVMALLLYPAVWSVPIQFVALGIGASVGILNVAMMLLLASALRQGPSGLTFAFQNASAVFPGILLFLLFGSSFDFSLSYYQIAGMGLVILGLFSGTKKTSLSSLAIWLKYTLACFFVQTLALTCIQGRCVLFEQEKLPQFLLPFTLTQQDDAWFMPGQFGAAFLLQVFLWLREKARPQLTTTVFGFFSGLANFGSTFLLLLATKVALPFEKIVLFPCFAVSSILLCNLWANRLYQEKFNFKANLLCMLGIFLSVF